MTEFAAPIVTSSHITAAWCDNLIVISLTARGTPIELMPSLSVEMPAERARIFATDLLALLDDRPEEADGSIAARASRRAS